MSIIGSIDWGAFNSLWEKSGNVLRQAHDYFMAHDAESAVGLVCTSDIPVHAKIAFFMWASKTAQNGEVGTQLQLLYAMHGFGAVCGEVVAETISESTFIRYMRSHKIEIDLLRGKLDSRKFIHGLQMVQPMGNEAEDAVRALAHLKTQ